MTRRPQGITAGVFDMDGVLLDSEPLHHAAVNEVLEEDGRVPLSTDEFARYLGTTDEYTWEDLVVRRHLEAPIAHYRERFDTRIVEQYRQHSTVSPGVRELLVALRAYDLPLAVASSARTHWVETSLNALGIRDFFTVVVSGEMVQRGKPDPEIFLAAARALDAHPENCFAVEDSPKGVLAARAAGMLTIAVETPYTRDYPLQGSHLRISSLDEFDLSILERLAV